MADEKKQLTYPPATLADEPKPLDVPAPSSKHVTIKRAELFEFLNVFRDLVKRARFEVNQMEKLSEFYKAVRSQLPEDDKAETPFTLVRQNLLHLYLNHLSVVKMVSVDIDEFDSIVKVTRGVEAALNAK